MKPTYILKNASFFYDEYDNERAAGDVYGHPDFQPGEPIITSVIVAFDVALNILETKNSRYEIQNWKRRKEDADKEFATEEEIREVFFGLQESFRGKNLR